MKTITFSRLRLVRSPGTRNARLVAGPLSFACQIGRRGVAVRKREGDGTTPAGRFRLVFAFIRRDRIGFVASGLPLRAMRRDDGWCDDPAAGSYNRAIRLPARAGHENLWRNDSLYDVVIVLDHNQRPRVRGAGSAIFFHLSSGEPTEGCIAIRAGDMRRLLPRLSPRTVLIVPPDQPR